LEFAIYYQDDDIVIIDKPSGYFVHRSAYDATSTYIVLQRLRDQLGKKIYPVHRLDRKTSGALIFALNPEYQKLLGELFRNKQIAKKYLAVIRGYLKDIQVVEYPLLSEKGVVQECETIFEPISNVELPFASSARFPTSRYSLVLAKPVTGRQHQIRRHLAHLRLPIIGDRPYGCSKQNRFFLAQWEWSRLMLHSWKIEIPALPNKTPIQVTIPPDPEFLAMLEKLQLECPVD
jgi:tRNA pseudouridine65 synthase